MEDSGLRAEGKAGGARPWQRAEQGPTLLAVREEVRLGGAPVCRGRSGVGRPWFPHTPRPCCLRSVAQAAELARSLGGRGLRG